RLRFRFDRPPQQQGHAVVSSVFVVGQEIVNHGKSVICRQTSCRTGELTANLQIRLVFGEFRQFCREVRGDLLCVPQKANGPKAQERISVVEVVGRQLLLQTGAEVDCPQCVQRRGLRTWPHLNLSLSAEPAGELLETRRYGRVLAITELPKCLL